MVRLKPPSLRAMVWLLLLAGTVKALGFLAEGAAHAAGTTATPEASAPVAAAATADGSAAACPTPEALLQSVQQERALLDKEKSDLASRSAKLDLARQEVESQTARLTELKTEVQGLMDKAKASHSADVDRLVKLYQSMRPQDAAGLLDGMDLEVSVRVLSTMNERQAAQIMAKMSPDRVAAVSKIILDRSKLPGDQNQVVVKLN